MNENCAWDQTGAKWETLTYDEAEAMMAAAEPGTFRILGKTLEVFNGSEWVPVTYD
jgi:hypothetical protein